MNDYSVAILSLLFSEAKKRFLTVPIINQNQ